MRACLEAFYSCVYQEAALHEGQVDPLFAWDPAFQRRTFVGADVCAGCHEPQAMQWMRTRHAKAYKTLLGAHRHYHPKCVVCHVVGLGRATGYRMARRRPAWPASPARYAMDRALST